MAWYSLKSEYFTTPLKLVLPGLIIATTGYYLFNNPEKIRAKNSRSAWNTLLKYEQIYGANSEELYCSYSLVTVEDLEKFNKDLIHFQEMTIENLKLLRDDKDIDKLMSAIINLRIDTYTQLRTITKQFIDTLIILDKNYRINRTDAKQYELSIKSIQEQFMSDRGHIGSRDSTIIKNLGIELKKNYASSFENINFNLSPTISLDTVKKRVIGSWSLKKDDIPVVVSFNRSGIGKLIINEKKEVFAWNFDDVDSTAITMKFDNPAYTPWTLYVNSCDQRLLQYIDAGSRNEILLTACRIK